MPREQIQRLKKFLPMGTFGVSLMLHVIIFLAVGGIIIIHSVEPKQPFTPSAQAPSEELPMEPELPSEASPDVPNTESQDNAAPAQAAPSMELISSDAASTALSFVPMPTAISANGAGQGLSGAGKAQGGGGRKAPSFNPFGSSGINGDGLEGYFYDFKVSKTGAATGMTVPKWEKLMTRFANSPDWDGLDLDKYYKSPAPLYIKKFFIPTRDSKEAPKAFSVPNQPALWMILYKGMVIPPEDGTYNFVGYGDDVLVVKINGKLVLDAGWFLTVSSPQNEKTYPLIWNKTYGERCKLKIGKSFDVRAGEPVKIEIMISDQGGWCAFYLMLRKEGVNYGKLADGTLKLPLFQLDNESVNGEGTNPPFSTEKVPWKLGK